MLLSDWLDGVRQQFFPRWFSRPARRRRARLRPRRAVGHSFVPACVEILEPRTLLSAPVRITPDSTPPAIATLGVADYTSSNFGALVHLVQTGPGDVVFVDRLGNMVQGSSIDSTHVLAQGYGGQTATFSSGLVTWSDGTVWTPTDPTPGSLAITDFVNPFGAPVHDIRNDTNNLGIVDGLGRTSLGTMIDGATGTVGLYPGDFAHYAGNQVTWDDGFIWTKVVTPSIALKNDTGTSNGDRVTSDPTVQGTVSSLLDVKSVEAAFDTGNGSPALQRNCPKTVNCVAPG